MHVLIVTIKGGEIDKYWRASYKAIEDANRFIRGVETGPFYNEENTAVMQMLGEASVFVLWFIMIW